MMKKNNHQSIFSLPSNEKTASEIYYGLMVGGLFFFPMTLVVYHNFAAQHVNFSTREFFIIFSFVYILLFIFCSQFAKRYSEAIKKQFDRKIYRNAYSIAPAAWKSNSEGTIEIARKYWRWQLICSYLSGMGFSWIGCVFSLFIMQG